MKSYKEFNKLLEGFANKLRSGKVPVGEYRFKYVSKGNVDFISNSTKHRKSLKVIEKGRDYVIINGNANDHTSLITSLQSFGDINGYVEEE